MDLDFFGIKNDSFISHIQALRGYYPINQKGRWHSGIHITSFNNEKNGFCPIRNPLSGKILACNLNFDGKKKDNYFLLKNNLLIPTKDGNEKIDFYSLITHLSDYSFFEKLREKNIFIDLEDEEKNRLFEQPELPFCYRAVVKTDLENCKYFEIPSIGYLSEFSEIYVNRNGTKIGKNGTTSLCLPEMNVKYLSNPSNCKLFENFQTELFTIDKNSELECKGNNTYNVNSLNLTRNDTIEKKYGFVEVNPKNITNNGWCSRKDCNNVYYSILENLLPVFSKMYLVKENLSSTISAVLSSINNSISTKQKQLEELRRMTIESSYVRSVEKDLDQLREDFKQMSLIKNAYTDKGLLIIYGPSAIENKVTSRIGIKVTIEKKNASAIYIVTSHLFTCYDKQTYEFKNLLKKYEIPFFDAFEKCYSLKEEKIPNPLSLQMQQKVPNKTIDLQRGVISDSSFECYECRLHLVQGSKTNYSLELNIPDEKLFYKTTIGSLKNSACGSENKSYVYATKELTKTYNDNYYTKYYQPSIDWVSKEYEVLNFEEVINDYNMKEDEDDILCKISYGYVPICKSKLNIQIKRRVNNSKEISTNDDIIGMSLDKNTLLSYMGKEDFIDWSVFFTDNILSLKSDLWKVNIKQTDNVLCEKRKGRQKLYTTFLPINTTVELEEGTDVNGYKKIEKLSFIVYAYANNDINLKNNICQDTINKIFFYGTQIWIKDKKLEFFKNYEYKGNTINTLTKYNEQNPGCKIANKGDENYLKLESFLNLFILGQDGIFGKKFDNVQGDTYKECILTYSADDICNKLGIKGPIYILEKNLQYLPKSTTLSKGGLFDLYSDDSDETIKCNLPIPISFEYKKDKIPLENSKYIFDYENEKYQISDTDFLNYSHNYIEEYFDSLINLNFKDDKKEPFVSTKNCPADNLACKLKELKEELIEKDFFKDKKILSPDSNLLYEQDVYNTIINDFNSKIVALHPLEMSENDHKNIQNLLINHWKVPEWKEDLNDVYKDLSKTFTKKNEFSSNSNQFYFVYPPEFLNKMSELKLLEFNPYAGKTIHTSITTRSGVIKNYSEDVKSNPGFAPYIGSNKTDFEGYAIPTGTFNDDYSKYNTNYTEYYHDGVDFGAAEGTEIKSLIFGVVRWFTQNGNGKTGNNGGTGYGNMLFIENSDKTKVYVLCHVLPELWSKDTVINKQTYPNMTVAKVGNIGNSSGPHLHLTVIDCKWTDLCRPEDKKTFDYNNFRALNSKRIDPFDNEIYWKLPK